MPANGAGGVAFGIAPTRRLSIWTEADAQFQQGSSGAPAYTLLNETASRSTAACGSRSRRSCGPTTATPRVASFACALEADLLPRTHWNLGLSYYRDKTRGSGFVYQTLLAQLHLYL